MEQRGPWKVKGSEVKYKNPWIEVREDAVIRPDGKDGAYGVVVQGAGVSVLALDSEGFVYLVNEFRYAINQWSLETVSGAIDEGEEPIQAAKRELKEEAGILAENWVDLGGVNPTSSVVSCHQQLFLARDLSFTDHDRDAVEILEVRKIKFTDAIQMVMDGEITYGPACVLILKAARYLEDKRV